MPSLKREEPELLPGADLEQDCQTPDDGLTETAEAEVEHDHLITWTGLAGEG